MDTETNIYDANGDIRFGLPMSAYMENGEWKPGLWDAHPICKAVRSESDDWRDWYIVTGDMANGEPAYPYIYHCEGFVLSAADAELMGVQYEPEDVIPGVVGGQDVSSPSLVEIWDTNTGFAKG